MNHKPRIAPVAYGTADVKAKTILKIVEQSFGRIPNGIATMVHSPALARAYAALLQSLLNGPLDRKQCERLALVVAESNDSRYCVALHSALGFRAGLSKDDIEKARRAEADNESSKVLLVFAQRIVEKKGKVSNEDLAKVRNQGFGDREIVEIVGHVALNILTNYLNHVAGTEADYPEMPS